MVAKAEFNLQGASGHSQRPDQALNFVNKFQFLQIFFLWIENPTPPYNGCSLSLYPILTPGLFKFSKILKKVISVSLEPKSFCVSTYEIQTDEMIKKKKKKQPITDKNQRKPRCRKVFYTVCKLLLLIFSPLQLNIRSYCVAQLWGFTENKT